MTQEKTKKNDASARWALVVEDEPSISRVCQRVLSGEGFRVDVTPNGRAAQEIAGEKDYVLCLIDIRTPEMNGKELYQWLREAHPRLAGRVIFTTGDVMEGDLQRFIKETARPFLPKPFSPDNLRGIVRRALEDWRK